MANYLNVTAVASSIAGLSVSGVNMRGLTAIPERIEPRDCPVLYPKPDGFITNLNVERVSFGAPMDARKTIVYSLNYRYLHASIGVDRGLFAVYEGLIANTDAIISAVIDNDNLSGTIDITPTGIDNIGPVQDPAGNTFHGCDMTFVITVFVR